MDFISSAQNLVDLPDKRLNDRYWKMVKQHFKHAPKTAAGPALPPDAASTFSVTQAVWRFFDNDRVSLSKLVEPLALFAREHIRSPYTLAVIDWSKIDYFHHESKKDRIQRTHQYDIGPLPGGRIELPLVEMNRKMVAPLPILLAERTERRFFARKVSDQRKRMIETAWKRQMPRRQVVDREADSVYHWRSWISAGHLILIRGDDRRVLWRGRSQMYPEIEAQMDVEHSFHKTCRVKIRDRDGIREVCETSILLRRAALRRVDGRRTYFRGDPLELRLVIVRIRDEKMNEVLST